VNRWDVERLRGGLSWRARVSLGASGYAELVVDVARVRLDRVEGEVKLARDLALGELAAQKAQHRELAPRPR
jgi:hypothetical protein